MDSLKKKEKNVVTFNSSSCPSSDDDANDETCMKPSCFFCIIKERDPAIKRAGIEECFNELPLTDDQEHVLVLSSLWNIAMSQPDNPQFPSLGIFKCMGDLINRGINDREWLFSNQNIYIPYYAAHIIGSYTMNKVEFAEKAVKSGVIFPLIELMRGKMSWVEQRVAVRALGHLASYQSTFQDVAVYKDVVVTLAMHVSSTCLDEVYVKFVGVNEKNERSKYHIGLLTRGIGGLEMENKKAEEWASQLQCWSIYILNCFAIKERGIHLMCKQEFLEDLCEMWGGWINHSSPVGVGLVRILCYSKHGRKKISESEHVLKSLCNLSISSDDWQYMGIDCLLFLLNDQDTRCKTIKIAACFLVDLIDLRNLGDRSHVGETITRMLLLDYTKGKSKIKNKKVQKVLDDLWNLKVERRRKEKMMSDENVENLRVFVNVIKEEANIMFRSRHVEEAIAMYTQALDLCPLKLRKERMIIYSNRAQCHLIQNDPDGAIRDSTRALCLSNPANSHHRSLWRRSQAYHMKGLAKESFMDCLLFINGFMKLETTKGVRIPYYATRMISKQMEATWLFTAAKSRSLTCDTSNVGGSAGEDSMQQKDEIMRVQMQNKNFKSRLSTVVEEEHSLRKCIRKQKRSEEVGVLL